MSLDLGADEYRVEITKATEELMARLMEHHNFNIPKPVVVPKKIPIATKGEPLPVEVCILPIEGKLTIDGVKRVVCKYFGVSHTDLISSRRDRAVQRPRMVAIYLARALTPHSLPEIGRRFGGRDHTTILHSHRKVELMLKDKHPIANDVAYLWEVLCA